MKKLLYKLPAQMALGIAFFLLIPSLLFAGYTLKSGYATNGVIVTSEEQSTFLKVIITAHQGRLEDYYEYKEKQKYEDTILEMKESDIKKIRRSYYSYFQTTKPLGTEERQKGIHNLSGTTWEIERKGKRDVVTLLTGKIPEPAFKIVRLSDVMDHVCEYLPRKEIQPGLEWSIPREGLEKILGDNWEKGAKGVMKCKFLRRVFYKGYQCAKISVVVKVEGMHKVGGNAKTDLEGELFYSLEYGFPVYLELKGTLRAQVIQTAPRGQTISSTVEGPMKMIYSKEYRPPEDSNEKNEKSGND